MFPPRRHKPKREASQHNASKEGHDRKSPNPQRAPKDGSHRQQPPTPTDTAPHTSEPPLHLGHETRFALERQAGRGRQLSHLVLVKQTKCIPICMPGSSFMHIVDISEITATISVLKHKQTYYSIRVIQLNPGNGGANSTSNRLGATYA
jgi:hypothetical protein